METPGLVVHGEAAPFSTALRSLLNNPQYSDVCFVVGQERQEVFAHRCLLACRCNFFQRLLGPKLGPGTPSPVVLSSVPADAFLAVLEFLYANSVRLHRHSVLEVLTAAVEYGLEELRELCLEFVAKVLDVELVCEALQVGVAGPACRWASAWRAALLTRQPSFCSQVAVTFGLGPLQERCIAFIETHTQAVLERPVAEVAAPVVRELRLALLAPAELSALEEQNQREPLIPVEQIVEAWKCHALRRGDAARGAPCRRRRGTLPREHHCFLDLPFK
ncbi:BTB/POZ domain-containing protein 19 isoform X4 [Lontra canadensis]|uniref:BTB/POZ domain-containing protein 19 isoform X4 n=1 Tax=Lontra canadensis TaxID=76717 RepID=UPI0013F381C1|nr:BTB/POZ domain-containing protein 19 isoform X4 [Lontra canadensis]